MGISLYLVWKQKGGAEMKTALIYFAIQLGLNTLWSIIFFGMRLPSVAFIEILILLFFIVLTVIKFFPLSKVSAYLLIPYLFWVSFASLLNFYIVKLN
jgi:tryptophan-rich sensory protein